MTKQELNQRTDTELTPVENALINFNVYWNPDHIEYYQNYQIGNYQWCYDYLMNNRGLLVIENTPEEYKEVADKQIEVLETMLSKSDTSPVGSNKTSHFNRRFQTGIEIKTKKNKTANRIGDIPDQQLLSDIRSGKRSDFIGELTKIEIEELIQLIKKKGGVAKLEGTVLWTDRTDLHNKYIEEYVMRKLAL